MSLTLQEIIDEVTTTNLEKGHRDHGDVPDFDGIMMRAALLHTEVSEAVQIVKRYGVRKSFEPAIAGEYRDQFALEMADVIIRTIDLSDLMGIDLEEAVAQKMAFNRLRPYKYGTRDEAAIDEPHPEDEEDCDIPWK